MTQKRTLISVYDKTGVVELARELADLDWEIISSGGTAKAISDAGIAVTTVEEQTGLRAILNHRVATLDYHIHGGILADTNKPEHLADMEEYGIQTIDLVVGGLYPFSDTVASGASFAECIEKIDVGGPTLLRGAAKNHARVGVVTSPEDYPLVLEELRANGELSDQTRQYLAKKAFAHTAAYDAAIASWMQQGELLPETLHMSLTRAPLALRYGENPHQQAALYTLDGTDPWWNDIIQHSGIASSYLNMYDADAAWRLVHEPALDDGTPKCAIIKHANPCGFATAPTLAEAYRRAFECDPMSAFGGIVAVNQIIDNKTVVEMVAAAQADVVIAPGYAPGVVEQLIAKRKNTRLLEASAPSFGGVHLRQITDGLLVQEAHHFVATNPSEWQVVTQRQPTAEELRDGYLAFILGGYVKSNSIVLTAGGVAWGIGAGQQNRLESAEIATKKAAGRARGGALGSDAFFPFSDGIESAARAEVSLIVQPGGSVRDDECIAKADELGIAMVFTGERHFIH